MTTHTFAITSDFLRNGSPVKLISGTIHYFRVVPEYWLDRLEKLKAMGCNAVETYVAWNVHEPRKGQFRFDGNADIARFINLAASLDLMVILRPGPYICAEWEFGGFPAWLLAEDGLALRTRCPKFMRHVEDYFSVLLPRLTPHQFTNGGPVVLFQVENEYGSFGDDHAYMAAIRDMLLKYGVTTPLCTSDGPDGVMLACGSIGGALAMANFGSRAAPRMARLAQFLGGRGPSMCMEYWVGWFDAWGGGAHRTTDAAANAQTLDEILAAGSVNFYMFHGGTNFGFMNGSNDYGTLTPDVTSYDYDAPLSEDGQLTPKYRLLRDVIARYAEVPKLEFSTAIERRAFGEFPVSRRVSLFRTLSAICAPQVHDQPQCMEKLGQNYGYTLYSARFGGEPIEKIQLMGANDRAQVFVNGECRLTLFDRELLTEHAVDWPDEGDMRLDILVENMGRVNFGPRLVSQRKGVDGAILVNARHHTSWTHWPLEMDAAMLEKIDFSAGYDAGTPAFYAAQFPIDEPADTFLHLPGWGKGFAVLNGFNLGRYWSVGPQKRLYIPAPLLKKGLNHLILFESEGQPAPTIILSDHPDLG